MTIRHRMSAPTTSALAYLLLITAFAALGLFVATLATGSRWAAPAGIGLIACMAGSVLGFRAAARKLARAGAFDDAASPVSIFSAPRRQDEVDRYLETYRGAVPTVPIINDNPARPSAAVSGRRAA